MKIYLESNVLVLAAWGLPAADESTVSVRASDARVGEARGNSGYSHNYAGQCINVTTVSKQHPKARLDC